jgi:hypothetical protein
MCRWWIKTIDQKPLSCPAGTSSFRWPTQLGGSPETCGFKTNTWVIAAGTSGTCIAAHHTHRMPGAQRTQERGCMRLPASRRQPSAPLATQIATRPAARVRWAGRWLLAVHCSPGHEQDLGTCVRPAACSCWIQCSGWGPSLQPCSSPWPCTATATGGASGWVAVLHVPRPPAVVQLRSTAASMPERGLQGARLQEEEE